ncbi:MAG TPA: hypothetical protein VGX78_16480 [Pirellulales bacterium]|jgi:hypothetical protein|nr:hypothetical protein [Pirellulales bacterium]
MKCTVMVLLVGVLGAGGNAATAAERQSALGAIGLGGTLVGSSDRSRSRNTPQTLRTGFPTPVYNHDRHSRYFDERRKRAEQYFELRRMNQRYRDERRSPSLTPEQLADINASRLPRRLTAEQWEPTAGVIHWPALLRGDEQAAGRARLEQLFAERTPEDSGVGGAAYGEVRLLTRQMRDQLARRVKELSIEEFSVASKFLASLAYEARFAEVAAR